MSNKKSDMQKIISNINSLHNLKLLISSVLGNDYKLLNNNLPKKVKSMELKLHHSKCNQTYKAKLSWILKYNYCCPCKNFSYGEKLVADFLQRNKVSYYPQYPVKIKNRTDINEFQNVIDIKKRGRYHIFDFVIMKGNTILVVIEVDGEQHERPVEKFGGEDAFKKIVYRDKLKDLYTQKKDIVMIRIPYNKLNQVSDILYKELTECEIIKK